MSKIGQQKVSIVFSLLLMVFMIIMIVIYGFFAVYYQEENSLQYVSNNLGSQGNSGTSTNNGGSSTVEDSFFEKLGANSSSQGPAIFGIANLTHLIMDTVFTLLGFGLLFSPYRNAKWTGLSIALFVVSFNIILGLLFQDMWFEILFGFRKHITNGQYGFLSQKRIFQFWDRHVTVSKSTASYLSFRLSNLCSTSYFVGITAFFGKITIQRIAFSLPIFCLIFYLNLYLNVLLCLSTTKKDQSFKYLDNYGTMLVYLFGSAFGIIAGIFMRTPKENQQKLEKQQKSRVSLQFSLLGALFLFGTFVFSYTGILTFPNQISFSFDQAFQSQLNFRFNSGAILVIFGLIAGIIGNYVGSLLFGIGKMQVQNIIMGTMCGGIMVGGLCDVIESIGACLFLGFIGGVISGIWMSVVTPKINGSSIVDCFGMVGPVLIVSLLASIIVHPSILHVFYVKRGTLTLRSTGEPQNDWRVAPYHLIYMGLCLGFGLIAGIVLGLIYCIKSSTENNFQDAKFFAEDYGLYNFQYVSKIKGENDTPDQNQQGTSDAFMKNQSNNALQVE